MGEPARAVWPLTADMLDIEVAARAMASVEARRLGLSTAAYVENNWRRWIEHATQTIYELDAERLRRALFAKGDLAKALVTAEAMSADAEAYRGVLKP